MACDEAGIDVYVPRPLTSTNKKLGLYEKADFRYDPERDEYRCPAGERLPKRTTTQYTGKTEYRYWSLNYGSCRLKSKCTTGTERRVTRWAREDVLDAMHARVDRHPEMMRLRRDTVEHPFGTLKRWTGAEHFLMKGLHHTGTEMSLHVLCYNLKRVMNLLGVETLIRALCALFLALFFRLNVVDRLCGERYFDELIIAKTSSANLLRRGAH